MVEAEFFGLLCAHVKRYVLTVRRFDMCPDEPYFVELHARNTTYRCKGFTPGQCFDSIIEALGILAPYRVPVHVEPSPPLDATAPPPESKRGKTSSG